MCLARAASGPADRLDEQVTTQSATETPLPAWSVALFAAGITLMLGGLVAVVLTRSERWERRLYWATWSVGGAAGSASLLVRSLALALVTYAMLLLTAVVWAFFRTDYIVLGGRTIAATPADREAE